MCQRRACIDAGFRRRGDGIWNGRRTRECRCRIDWERSIEARRDPADSAALPSAGEDGQGLRATNQSHVPRDGALARGSATEAKISVKKERENMSTATVVTQDGQAGPTGIDA